MTDDIKENSDQKPKKPPPNPVREAILMLAEEAGIGGVFPPSKAAQEVSEEKWQKVLNDVRAEAIRLMKSGHITIYRKGRPVQSLRGKP
jgi:hypothetical protein